MKTAIDWLVNELPTIDWSDPYYKAKLEEAKAMEKQQIMAAHDSCEYKGTIHDLEFETAEEYYNRTFNTTDR
jgi:hypothetical protein